jgi:uncharacterized membrane protein
MDQSRPQFDVVIRPYRSLGRDGFRAVMIAVVAANAIFGTIMLVNGAWPVTGLMGLDALAVYVAFRLSYRQTRACERITITGQTLLVSRHDERGRAAEWHLPAYWTHVRYDDQADWRGVLKVGSHGRELEIGRFLHPDERATFARDLDAALRHARAFHAAT